MSPEPHLKNSWKIMLIGLYTGQRVSDLLTLDKSQLRLNQNGNLYIDFIQQKTGVRVTVAIGDPLIIEILLDDFPEKTYTQIFNKHLKKICEKAGLTNSVIGYKMSETTRRKLKGNFRKCDLICAHDLRRSFATNYYGKVQTPILMRITGHKKESTFLEYIGEKFNQDHYADLFLSQACDR
jgi:integrase